MMTPMQRVDVLRAACCVAGADGLIDDSEKTLIRKIAREVGVGKASLDAIMQRAANDPDFHRIQFRILKSDPQQCMATILEVAMSDGGISDDETRVLRSLAANLEVPDGVFDELIDRASKLQ